MSCALEAAKWVWQDNCRFDGKINAVEGRTYKAYVSCDTAYAFSLNGEVIRCGQFCDCADYKYYHVFDITAELCPGENTLTVATAAGSSSGLIYAVTEDGKIILASGADGQHTISRTAALQKYPAPVPTLGERIPAALRAWGALKQGSDGLRNAYLTAPSAEAVTLSSEGIAITAQEADCDGLWLSIDLGAETVGYVDLELELPCTCDLLVGDRLYHGKQGENRIFDPLNRVDLRELHIRIAAGAVKLGYVGLRPAVYPLDRKPAFICSDRLYNRIYTRCAEKLACGALTGEKEHLPELALRNRLLGAYYCFNETATAKASIRLMADMIRRGELTDPIACARFVTLMFEYCFYSGNVSLAAELLDVPKAVTADLLARLDKNGLIRSTDESGAEIYDAVCSAWVSMALASVAGICRMVSQRAESVEYLALQSKLNAAIDVRFWNAEKKAYAARVMADSGVQTGYTQFAQALLVCCEACPEEKLDAALETLASGDLGPADLAEHIYVYDALMKRDERYGELVVNEITDKWGDLLFDDADSLTCAAAAVPVYVAYRYIAGFRIWGDGRLKCERRPAACGMHTFAAVLSNVKLTMRSDSTMPTAAKA